MTTAALDGVTVLDLTQFEAGTVCTETLAWLGANVIKVERPITGEQGRAAAADWPEADSYHFILLNANKKSITANVKHPEGQALVRRLLERADVFVENFRPGTIERLGFGYEAVSSVNPRIIYAQIKGFGSDGPYASFPAFDPVGQATGGAASITGEAEGPPMRTGPNLADSGTGFHSAIAILAALYQREMTGMGQRIEVAMQDVVINYCRPTYGRQLTDGQPAERGGNEMPMAPVSPCGAYPCRPGGPNDYVFIYTSRWPGSRQWERLLEIIGRADALEDPRFATPESRYEHRAEVDAMISEWTSTKTKLEAMEELGHADVPAGAVLSTVELASDPYLRERGMFVTVDHPVRGAITMPGFPLKMSASSVPILPAPLLGQHNEEVYSGMLGMSPDELDRLRQSGVI
jgi:formyl-CoA transferase